MHDAFHAVLDGNDSDNDEALDTTWLPSDCKVNENEKIKTKGKAGSGDLGTGALLTDVDGGYYAKKWRISANLRFQASYEGLK